MLERGKLDRGIVEIVDTESLVPRDHLLRKIDAAVDFNRLYEMVEPLYSEDLFTPPVKVKITGGTAWSLLCCSKWC